MVYGILLNLVGLLCLGNAAKEVRRLATAAAARGSRQTLWGTGMEDVVESSSLAVEVDKNVDNGNVTEFDITSTVVV